jgi:isocitrate dehydrogenase
MYERITPLSVGERIPLKAGEPVVPDKPIVPYIRGDGTGVDIWAAAQRFFSDPIATSFKGHYRAISVSSSSFIMRRNRAMLCQVSIEYGAWRAP